MVKHAIASAQNSAFGLKNEARELLPSARSSEQLIMGVRELEQFRTGTSTIPASKNGLETICGASCDTGAM
jgi:hypothetical protein